jgi:preprotein translocase subunit YajC
MPSLIDVLINWFPMLMFVGVMIFLTRRIRPQQQRQDDLHNAQMEALRRQNDLLERIVRVLEKR